MAGASMTILYPSHFTRLCVRICICVCLDLYEVQGSYRFTLTFVTLGDKHVFMVVCLRLEMTNLQKICPYVRAIIG